VLTGIGTVEMDDPRLDVRLVPTVLQPLRVVVDSDLRISPQARLLAPPGRAMVVSAVAAPELSRALTAQGVEVLQMGGADGRVDLHALLEELGRRGTNELHVEAGERLNAALLEADLVDEWLVYLAPMFIGPGRGMAAQPALAALSESRRLQFIECTACGPDLRVRAQPPGRDGFVRSALGPPIPACRDT
jgi:diaminohydroxyphosphoribosylaminopyrimidine deaminase/5-amino-6-(5-phosphoribosylamino)uracil reductase